MTQYFQHYAARLLLPSRRWPRDSRFLNPELCVSADAWLVGNPEM